MDFGLTPRVQELQRQVTAFMEERVYPSEPVLHHQVLASRWTQPAIIEELKAEARARGLWNLFLPHHELGAGLSNLEYAPLAEIMGRSVELAPETMNCA